ncbi:MAG: extensin family protein, partial [Pseudomonadota bacterium]
RAIMGCEVSESLANWTVKVAIPQAKLKFGKPLTEIEQYASYVCRSRNSLRGARLSEHAKGNAIDLGRFHLADGTVVDVASDADEDSPEQRFLQVLRDEGCTYFKTVLGPGSDPYHDTHFHFDMAQRRNGSHYCR